MTVTTDRPDHTRRWRGAAALIALGGAMLVGPLTFGIVTARAAAPTFTGFNFDATASSVYMTGGSPASQSYPQVQGHLPHAATSLSTGPAGHALASLAWPGALVGNAGTLAAFLGAPDDAKQADYRVRAEAFSSGPTESTMEPGMHAKALGNLAEATGRVQEFATPAFTVDDAQTFSRNELGAADGTSTASAIVSGLSLADGVVTIKSVTTTAVAATDGVRGDASGSTIVKGLVVGGQPATVDERGVHFGDQSNPNPADAVAQAVGDNVLTNIGMTMYLVKPQSRTEGGLASYRSGSLVIEWDVFDQHQGIGVLMIGGATAFADASPASDVTLPTLPPVTSAPLEPSLTVPPAVGGIATTPPSLGGELSTPPPASTGGGDEQAAGPTSFAAEPASYFKGISPGMVILALAGAGMIGAGFRRLQDGVLDIVEGECPLEGGS